MRTLILLALSIVMLQGCSRSTVDAGDEGVMIYKPYFFGSGGVDSKPIEAGAIWTAWSTQVVRYNIKPMKYKEPFVDLTASDNVAIDFDMYLTLQKLKGSSPEIHEKWGKKFYTNNIKDVFRKITRNEARTRSSIELRTDEKVINAMQENVMEKVIAYLEKEGMPITVKKVITGKVVPPAEVLKEAAATAAQKQRKQTQDMIVEAERARLKAEGARALADREYMKKLGMSPQQFIRLKELDIIAEKEDVTVYMGVSPIPIKQM